MEPKVGYSAPPFLAHGYSLSLPRAQADVRDYLDRISRARLEGSVYVAIIQSNVPSHATVELCADKISLERSLQALTIAVQRLSKVYGLPQPEPPFSLLEADLAGIREKAEEIVAQIRTCHFVDTNGKIRSTFSLPLEDAIQMVMKALAGALITPAPDRVGK
jgi:hypothetical protein